MFVICVRIYSGELFFFLDDREDTIWLVMFTGGVGK